MNKNEKFVKMLKKVLNEIITNKIYKKSSTKKKIIDITWVDDPNLFNQLVIMLLIDIVKTKIQLNYYLFKTF